MHVRDGKLPDVTENEEREMRDEIDHWLVSTVVYTQPKMLHLPDSDGETPLCEDYDPDGFAEKDLAVYPVGYRDVCTQCGYKWRNDGENDEI